jgi:hypothetical protein
MGGGNGREDLKRLLDEVRQYCSTVSCLHQPYLEPRCGGNPKSAGKIYLLVNELAIKAIGNTQYLQVILYP